MFHPHPSFSLSSLPLTCVRSRLIPFHVSRFGCAIPHPSAFREGLTHRPLPPFPSPPLFCMLSAAFPSLSFAFPMLLLCFAPLASKSIDLGQRQRKKGNETVGQASRQSGGGGGGALSAPSFPFLLLAIPPLPLPTYKRVQFRRSGCCWEGGRGEGGGE